MANQGFLGVNPGGAWVATGDPATVNEATPEQPGQIGAAVALIPSGQKQARQYRYVKRYASDTVTWAAGQVVFWQDVDDGIVTGDTANDIPGLIAGVALGTLPAAGNYGFIQEAGVGSVLVKGTPSTNVVPGCILVVPNDSTASDAALATYTMVTSASLTDGSAAVIYGHRRVGVALSRGITTGITVPTTVTALIIPTSRIQFQGGYMAFTVSLSNRGKAGNFRVNQGRITLGSGTYVSTAGLAMAPGSFRLNAVDFIHFEDPDGSDIRAHFDKTGQAVFLFLTNGASHTNGSNLTTWGDKVDFLAFGR